MFYLRLFCTLGLLTCLPFGCLRVPDDLDQPAQQGLAAAPTTAEEVLDRYVRALGGEKRLRKLEQRTMEARIVFLPVEGCTDEDDEQCLTEKQTGTFVLQTTADGRMYRRTVVANSVMEQGFDGKQGWQRIPDGTLRLDPSRENKLTRQDARLHWYLDPVKNGIEVTLIGSQNNDSQDEQHLLDGLRWRVVGVEDFKKELWFDRTTGLLHEEIIEQGAGEGVTRQVIRYSDYRATDGVKIARKISVVTSQGPYRQPVQFAVQRISHGSSDASAYALPTPEKGKKKPDPRRTKLAEARSQAANANDAASWMAYARAAWTASEFADAREAAQKTLALDPKEPEAIWTLVRLDVLEGDYASAQKQLARAAKVGIRGEQIGRQEAWIYSHQRQFRKLADNLDRLGNSPLAARYRSFAGEPLRLQGKTCTTTLPLIETLPTPLVRLKVGDDEVITLIDSGAADLILSDELPASKAVAVQTRSQLGPEGPDVGHGQLERLHFGDLALENIPVDIMPREALQGMARGQKHGVAAVLGLRVLERFQVTFDIPGEQLILVPRTKSCQGEAAGRTQGDGVPFWLHETNFLYVRASMNGAPGLYLLNTGMRGVSVAATREAYEHAGVAAPAIKPDEPPLIQVDRVAIDDRIGLDNATGAWGYFEQTQSTDGFAIDGMVGMEVFGPRRWTIDFDRQRIYVAP